jgi:hypothetical protein
MGWRSGSCWVHSESAAGRTGAGGGGAGQLGPGIRDWGLRRRRTGDSQSAAAMQIQDWGFRRPFESTIGTDWGLRRRNGSIKTGAPQAAAVWIRDWGLRRRSLDQ